MINVSCWNDVLSTLRLLEPSKRGKEGRGEVLSGKICLCMHQRFHPVKFAAVYWSNGKQDLFATGFKTCWTDPQVWELTRETVFTSETDKQTNGHTEMTCGNS